MSATDPLIQRVAAALGRPADELLELDRRPVPLAFTPGRFVTLVLRDAATRETLEPTVDAATGALADRAALRGADRLAGAGLPALSPRLLELLLRHPDLPRLDVTVRRASGTRLERLSGAEVGLLARSEDVLTLELSADPVVYDD